MQLIDIDDVVVLPGRQRTAFDQKKLDDLVASIAIGGLFHPILLRADRKTLIAGERRLRALKHMFANEIVVQHDGEEIFGHVPYVTIGELSDLDIFQAEFDENVRGRANLTWQEEAAALSKLHKLRSAKAEAEGKQQRKADTVAEYLDLDVGEAVGGYVSMVSNALLVEEHLDDPDVAKAKSLNEAAKIVTRKMEKAYADQLHADIPISTAVAGHTVLHGSCLDHLPTLPDGRFSLAIIDPPYGVGAQSWQPQSGSDSGLMHAYEDDPKIVDDIVIKSLTLSWYKMAPAAHIYMFCDIRRYEYWNSVLLGLGWQTWYRPIIWDKMGQGNLVGNCDGPRLTYEAILYARKGNKGINAVYPDVLHHTSPSVKIHAAEKPISLYEELMSVSCIAGEHVIDFFCGSGPVFPAATRRRLYATGIELEAVNVEHARNRINKGTQENDLQIDF